MGVYSVCVIGMYNLLCKTFAAQIFLSHQFVLCLASGLLLFSDGPLNPDSQSWNMSDMFRPFQTLLYKIRSVTKQTDFYRVITDAVATSHNI